MQLSMLIQDMVIPASNRWLTITRIDDNRFTVKVLDITPSTNTSAHTFKYAKAGAMKRGTVRSGGSFSHTFTIIRIMV